DGRRRAALTAGQEALTLTATAARRTLVERLAQPEDDSAPRRRPAPTARAAPAPAAPVPAGAPAPAPAEPLPAAPPGVVKSSPTLMDLYDQPIEESAPAVEPAPPTHQALAAGPAA